MNINLEHTITQYSQAYQKLYDRAPRQIQHLENGWLIVNDAKMTVSDFESLTRQLHQETNKEVRTSLSALVRVVRWFQHQ